MDPATKTWEVGVRALQQVHELRWTINELCLRFNNLPVTSTADRYFTDQSGAALATLQDVESALRWALDYVKLPQEPE